MKQTILNLALAGSLLSFVGSGLSYAETTPATGEDLSKPQVQHVVKKAEKKMHKHHHRHAQDKKENPKG
jgi:hypothetical protein